MSLFLPAVCTVTEIVQPWLPFPQDYKYEENKAQIPLIIHHKE